MKQQIVFFIDTENPLSETQALLIKLSCYMYSKAKFSVSFVNNFHQADLEKNPELFSVFRDINTTDFSMFEGATFITPINYLMHLIVRIKDLKSAKICLYVYDKNAINWLLNNLHGDAACRTGIENLLFNSNSCLFLDGNCISSQISFNSINPPAFLPISLDSPESNTYTPQEIIDPNIINIGFIGNLSNESINSINNIIRNLSIQNLSKPVNIHIIGSIKSMYNFSFRDCSSSVSRVIYTGFLTSSQKMDYVQKNIDIAFGVEKNSIETALCGVPVVLPVIEEKPFIGNRYVYLFDVTKHIYKWNNMSLLALDNICYTLGQIINDVYDSNRKVELAKKCYEYFRNNNSFLALQKTIVSSINSTSLTLSDCLSNPIINNRLLAFLDFNNDNYQGFNAFLKNNIKNTATSIPSVPKLPGNDQPIIASIDKTKKKLFLKNYRSFSKKKRIIHNILKKNKILKVAFLVIFDSVFPSRPIFEKMLNDPLFAPYIYVIPNVQNSLKYQISTIKLSYDALFAQYGERVILAYDYKTDSYYDFKDEYQIIFFSNPYKILAHPLHDIEYFLDKPVLPIYVSYGFAAIKFWEDVIKTDFYNYNWKVSIENEMNFNHLKTVQPIEGKNALVTGYIKMDKYAQLKPSDRSRKRIIISPHHTVWGWKNLNISNFLSYSDFFLDLPFLFPDIDFVFRPHPLLFPNLLTHKIWDKTTLDNYIAKILNCPNMIYDKSGDYLQSFMDSDALIHDCGSFIAEYLFTKKPCCYMMKSEAETYSGLIPIGKECMDNHYHAYSKKDIIDFIKTVVVNGNDPLKEKRELFASNKLYNNYPNSSEFLINYIKSELKIK